MFPCKIKLGSDTLEVINFVHKEVRDIAEGSRSHLLYCMIIVLKGSRNSDN